MDGAAQAAPFFAEMPMNIRRSCFFIFTCRAFSRCGAWRAYAAAAMLLLAIMPANAQNTNGAEKHEQQEDEEIERKPVFALSLDLWQLPGGIINLQGEGKYNKRIWWLATAGYGTRTLSLFDLALTPAGKAAMPSGAKLSTLPRDYMRQYSLGAGARHFLSRNNNYPEDYVFGAEGHGFFAQVDYVFRLTDVNYQTYGWVNETKFGQPVIVFRPFEHKVRYYRHSLTPSFGYRLLFKDSRLFVELAAGAQLSVATEAGDPENYRDYRRTIFDFGSSGIAPRAGLRFGVLF